MVLSTFFNVAIWLSLPFLLPRGPEVQGRRRERLRKFSLCKLHAWDPGDGGRERRDLTDGDAEPVCWKPTSFPVVSTGLTTELETMNLHSITQGHTNMSWFSQPHRPQHKDHPTMLESTVQLRKFYLILPSPYQFNTLVFLSFSKSLNFIQDPNDKLPTVTDPTLFLAFQVRKLRVIFNSSLPLTCISNLLS